MTSRVQLALNVADVEAATRFYALLFGTEPNKVRDGYANFAITDPPLKLVLLENPDPDGALNHLGLELTDSDAVEAASAAFAQRGLEARVSSQEACCHAVQNKVYVTAPEVPIGAWEFYTVLDDNPDNATNADGVCCASPTSAADDPADQAADPAADGGCCSPASSRDDAPACR